MTRRFAWTQADVDDLRRYYEHEPRLTNKEIATRMSLSIAQVQAGLFEFVIRPTINGMKELREKIEAEIRANQSAAAPRRNAKRKAEREQRKLNDLKLREMAPKVDYSQTLRKQAALPVSTPSWMKPITREQLMGRR